MNLVFWILMLHNQKESILKTRVDRDSIEDPEKSSTQSHPILGKGVRTHIGERVASLMSGLRNVTLPM